MNHKKETETESESLGFFDRMYHNTTSFMQKYRWWLITVLVLVLVAYIYSKRTELGISNLLTTSKPVIAQHELNIGDLPSFDSDAKKLFKL